MFKYIILERQYQKELKLIRKNSPTASDQNKHFCCNSGVCCWRAPGELNKKDIARLARHFNITEKEFFLNYCVIDAKNDGILFVRLRRVHQEPIAGTMIDCEETYSISSPCVFLTKDNKCSVQEVKPKICKDFKCWEKEKEYLLQEWSKEELINLGWENDI